MQILHETTFDKIDLPQRVYKYRKSFNMDHKRILKNNEIYFASPLNLDELHECNIPVDYDYITDEFIFEYAYKSAHT